MPPPFGMLLPCLCLAVAAENVGNLMLYHLANGISRRSEVLARIKVIRMLAVIARRRSESMLILQTAFCAASLSCSSGMPMAPGMLPPFSLMILTNSCGTEDEP